MLFVSKMNVNINMVHEIFAQCEFKVYVSTDATADAASCSTFAAFILTHEEGKPKIKKQIQDCLGSAKAIPIQWVQKLICVDAAASYAENLHLWCLASILNIFFRNFVPKYLEQRCKTKTQFTKQSFINKQTI